MRFLLSCKSHLTAVYAMQQVEKQKKDDKTKATIADIIKNIRDR